MLHRLWIHTVVLAAVLLFLFAGVASATTHTVCVSGCDFTTIQTAENAAVAGDTVYVYNGTYTENVDIANASVSFVGEGRDVVTVQAAVTSDHVFAVTADYVNISGFTVTGAMLSRNAGIELNHADYCNISDNTAISNFYSIFLNISCNDNTITDNNIQNNSEGGIIVNTSCINNTLSHNIITNNSVVSIYLVSSCNNNTITDNNIQNNSDGGIVVSTSCINNTLSHNIITNNSATGIYLFSSCNNNTITDNNIQNNSEGGIIVSTSCINNTLSHNIITNNSATGIYLFSSCNNNTVIGNNASGNSGSGIALSASHNNNITANKMVGNIYCGIQLTLSNDSILADNVIVNNVLWDYSFYLTNSNNTIRDPANTENHINIGDVGTEILIENTDSSAFSENSSADAKAYPNGNFSLHQSGVSEVIHIVQRDLSILPTNILTITSIPTWSTSGNHKKQWNITGTAGTFAYTIGDMLPDAEANITTDAGWNKTHTANVAGYVTGTYDGGWSDQNFTIISVVGGIRTETKVPVPLFITLTVLMLCGVLYVFHARTHISRIFTTLIAAWMAFMLSQMIVSGNVVQMVSALDSADVWSHDTVAIQIPALSYLLLFIGVILSIFLVKFVVVFGLAVIKEAQREEM